MPVSSKSVQRRRLLQGDPQALTSLYTQSDQLQQLIDWEAIMPMSRYAGGHDEQMEGLLKGATVLGHWNEGDYQGTVATCVRLEDGRVVMYNDSYGSCGGCDCWENASDDEVRTLCIGLANGAYIFQNLEDAKLFLRHADQKTHFDWGYGGTAKQLLKAIEEQEAESS